MLKRLKKFLKTGVFFVLCFVLGRSSNLFARNDFVPTPNDKQLVAEALKKLPDEQAPATVNLDDGLFKLQYKGHEYFILVGKKKEETQNNYGLRFFLFKKANGQIQFLETTHGEMDSYILQPVFKMVGNEIFIFGLIGTEYPWGMNVYQLTQTGLKNFGVIDVAPVSEGIEVRENFKLQLNPKGQPSVVFTIPLKLNPGSPNEQLMPLTQDEEIFFTYNGNKFVYSKTKKQN